MPLDGCNKPARETARIFAALLAIKSGLLAFDPTIRLYFGDSASYLYSAMTGWVPPDRSFLYGYVIRYTALAAHSMLALAVAQSMFGVITACLLFRILRDSFAASFALAASLAVIFAVEPSQLFFERMVMAESAGTMALAIMLYAGFAYLRGQRWHWIPIWSLAGIVAVAMRMSVLPVVLGFALLPLIVAALAAKPRPAFRLASVHLLVAIAATFGLHHAYKQIYGSVSATQPDYFAATGSFRLGLVAPLVTREEIRHVGLPSDLLDRIGPTLADPRAREAQLWAPDGLIARVREAAPANAEHIARKLADLAVRSDPFGLLRLSFATLADYFNSAAVEARVAEESGTRPADDDLANKLRLCCDYEVRGLESKRNPVARYFTGSTTWLTFCYFGLAPLALILLPMRWNSQYRDAALLLALTSFGMVLSQALFSHIASFRYLHPLPFVMLLCLGAIAAFLNERRARSAQS